MKINLKLVEINCITKAVPGLCGFSSMGKSAGVNKGQTVSNTHTHYRIQSAYSDVQINYINNYIHEF